MEPEWNISDCDSDVVMLGLRNCEKKSHIKFLNNRTWYKSFSFKKRRCYVTGEDITWKFARVGRKEVKHLLSKNKPVYDNLWISEESFNRYVCLK